MYSKAKICPIDTNEKMGQYRPMFFDLAKYGLDEVIIESEYFSKNDNIAQQIAQQEYSVVYLRDGLRKITAQKDGHKIPFESFINTLVLALLK
ncbi:MAG: hypothetical protein QHH13_05105 [Melioribacter sp.]|uniref:hypothetical protein n=1 Tax=Rosettibacter primus TaxID=3111523 RepID=UPI00247BE8A9|nr:hypothetical protein [Melioribacter sp.]